MTTAANDSLASPDEFNTTERINLAESVARFTQKHIAADLSEWERAGRIPREIHVLAADVGILGIGYPEEVGGSGGDPVDQSVVTQALIQAGGSGGVIAGLFTHGIALPHIIDEADRRRAKGDSAGADYLVQHYIRPVLAGELICALAVTEPDGGSDVAALRTRGTWTSPTTSSGGGTDSAGVVASGRTLSVTGNKTYITSGVRADFVVAAVRTGGPGAAGVSLVIIDTNSPGFDVVRSLDKMGWHCSDTAELALTDVGVPEANVLGPEMGFASLARHFVTERLSLAVTGYATAQRCMDLVRPWARDRETFGRPLATRQVVRHTLVEMHRSTDVARTYTRWVAARHARGEQVTTEALLAKQSAVEACEYVVDRAVQLFGGAGYMRDSEVERHYRDSRILGIGGGSTEVMTDLAARLLDV